MSTSFLTKSWTIILAIGIIIMDGRFPGYHICALNDLQSISYSKNSLLLSRRKSLTISFISVRRNIFSMFEKELLRLEKTIITKKTARVSAFVHSLCTKLFNKVSPTTATAFHYESGRTEISKLGTVSILWSNIYNAWCFKQYFRR